MMRVTLSAVFFALGLLGGTGCQKAREISALQRKEAASLVSEAQFAMTLRDYARAEEIYAKACALCPDTADYWVGLGASRKAQSHLTEARKAYESALKAHQDAFAKNSANTRLLLEQIYILALLGRMDDARSALKKARTVYGTDVQISNFTDQAFERMITNPDFKTLAL